MILKNFINLVNIFYLSIFILFTYTINKFIFISNIRHKFFLLLLLLTITVSIGLYYNLDGIIMLFFISELSIILIFITMFSQLYTFNKEIVNNYFKYIVVLILMLNYSFYEIQLVSHSNYYSHYSVNINDFFYIYNYLFEKQILVTVLIIAIITLFSIFFILLFFFLKQYQNSAISKNKNLNLLRKQNITHQSNYNTKIRIFSK
jgi:hypothetical protein